MKNMGDSGTFGSQKTMDAILKNKAKAPVAPKFMGTGTRARLNTAAEKQMFGRKGN